MNELLAGLLIGAVLTLTPIALRRIERNNKRAAKEV